ncbi:MAG TPA: hypothetical protein VLH79_08570 [Chthonomonadales bacterium]|nr:hypothetical protein [Chthonomonadales bacterium]
MGRQHKVHPSATYARRARMAAMGKPVPKSTRDGRTLSGVRCSTIGSITTFARSTMDPIARFCLSGRYARP